MGCCQQALESLLGVKKLHAQPFSKYLTVGVDEKRDCANLARRIIPAVLVYWLHPHAQEHVFVTMIDVTVTNCEYVLGLEK